MNIFEAIELGSKIYGSKKAFLQSAEYAKIHADFKADKKTAKKAPQKCLIYFSESRNGFVIETSSTEVCKSFLSFADSFLGIGSGVATFKSEDEAISFASKMNYRAA